MKCQVCNNTVEEIRYSKKADKMVCNSCMNELTGKKTRWAPKPCIIIDTREKSPLSFSTKIKTVTEGLKTGDYSLKGFEDIITIERKSMEDLIQTVTQNRERFDKELDRMKHRYAYIVIEGEWSDLCADSFSFSKANPASIRGTILSYSIKYPNIRILFTGNHDHTAKAVEHILSLVHKYNENGLLTKWI